MKRDCITIFLFHKRKTKDVHFQIIGHKTCLRAWHEYFFFHEISKKDQTIVRGWKLECDRLIATQQRSIHHSQKHDLQLASLVAFSSCLLVTGTSFKTSFMYNKSEEPLIIKRGFKVILRKLASSNVVIENSLWCKKPSAT